MLGFWLNVCCTLTSVFLFHYQLLSFWPSGCDGLTQPPRQPWNITRVWLIDSNGLAEMQQTQKHPRYKRRIIYRCLVLSRFNMIQSSKANTQTILKTTYKKEHQPKKDYIINDTWVAVFAWSPETDSLLQQLPLSAPQVPRPELPLPPAFRAPQRARWRPESPPLPRGQWRRKWGRALDLLAPDSFSRRILEQFATL